MAKQRKIPKFDQKEGPRDKYRNVHKTSHKHVYWYLALIVAIIGILGFFMTKWYLQTRIITPFPAPKVVTKPAPDRFWGSYLPGCYFCMKARSPQSPVFGLMWFSQTITDNQLPLRHWCDINDHLPKYGWLEHDGVNFGVQVIEDNHYQLVTTFVKRPGGLHGGDWTARISVTAKDPHYDSMMSLLFYAALDNQGRIQPVLQGSYLTAIQGDSEELGPFQLTFETTSPNLKMANHLVAVAPGIHQLKETVLRNLALFQLNDNKAMKVIGLVGNQVKGEIKGRPPNFLVYQATVTLPFEMEVVFESGSFPDRQSRLIKDAYSKELQKHRENFAKNFENVFNLQKKGFSKSEVQFGRAAFSNMIGGIGYFYGSSLVQSEYNAEPINSWPVALYTAVPSRPFFPRGFLWDEGFHNLMICQWNVDICKDIIAHWMNLINIQGWIPREQILGLEARSRVPQEFIVQHNSNANPPTLFLPLQYLMKKIKEMPSASQAEIDYLKLLYPRLEAWYQYFNTTQIGRIPGSYRWRGRNADTVLELNPKTLASGLDDYPRASHPTDDERHVDLYCWMALASKVMAEIGSIIGANSEKYAATYSYLANNDLLDKLHWSSDLQQYADYGLHSRKVRLERPKPTNIQPGRPVPKMEKVRVTIEPPQYRFVDSFGYVSLFPFLTQLIDPKSVKLKKILEDLENPDLLWTKFGLRSLAKTSQLYMKYNTEKDPPYWRGLIWFNINFLTVRSLHHYSLTDGPYKDIAKNVYEKLKYNLINAIYSEYNRTGFIWENYDDSTGKGRGCYPFTGWSALVLLIMGDSY